MTIPLNLNCRVGTFIARACLFLTAMGAGSTLYAQQQPPSHRDSTSRSGSQSQSTIRTPRTEDTAVGAEVDNNSLLLEYQLSERVLDRVWRLLSWFGAILGIALAAVGFFGFQTLADTLSKRIEMAIRTSVEKDVESLRVRVQDSLVELRVAVASQEQAAKDAREQLALSRELGPIADQLRGQLQSINTQVAELGSRLDVAVDAMSQMESRSEQLRSAVVASAAGQPAILGNSFDWRHGGKVEGKNFGTKSGTLSIQLIGRLSKSGEKRRAPIAKSPIYLIGAEAIDSWTDTQVRFHLTPEQSTETQSFLNTTDAQSMGVSLGKNESYTREYIYVITTSDGRIASSERNPVT